VPGGKEGFHASNQKSIRRLEEGLLVPTKIGGLIK
jgi:hypothetical protein